MHNDISEIPKIKEKWGSIYDVDEPIRDIVRLKAFYRLWNQQDPMFSKILAAAKGKAWSQQTDEKICSLKTFDSWLQDNCCSNFGVIRGTQRWNQKFNTVKNDWMKHMMIKFFAEGGWFSDR